MKSPKRQACNISHKHWQKLQSIYIQDNAFKTTEDVTQLLADSLEPEMCNTSFPKINPYGYLWTSFEILGLSRKLKK